MLMRYLVAVAVAALFGSPAAAQSQARAPREPRVFLGVNGAVQASPGDLSGRLEWDVYTETATADVDYPTGSAPAFDGGVGVRLWKQLGAGVAFSRYSRDGMAQVDARIPHPFFFDQYREISGEVETTRAETAVHVQVLYFLPAKGRLRVVLSGGPSRIEAEQDLVTDVQYTEEYPYDTATFRSATTRTFKEAKIGFNVGADVAYMFTRTFGVGGLVRFSGASMDLGPDNGKVSVDAGGLQAGGGIRIAF
jgi:hypothetical protein